MPPPSLELADIFRQHGAAYRQAHALPLHQWRLRAIENCRTAALGGAVEWCDHCQNTRIVFRSCRDRHCPQCQGLGCAHWLQQRTAELAQPLSACNARIFRMRRSRVPWTRSVGLLIGVPSVTEIRIQSFLSVSKWCARDPVAQQARLTMETALAARTYSTSQIKTFAGEAAPSGLHATWRKLVGVEPTRNTKYHTTGLKPAPSTGQD
jgi:hypothetical protein